MRALQGGQPARRPVPPDDPVEEQEQQELKVEQFVICSGMETREQRDAIQPGFYSWMMNIQPIGQRTLRLLNGKSATLYTAPAMKTIIYYSAYIISSTYYIGVFLSDGTADQVQISNGNVTHISAVATTFWNSTGAYPQIANFGNSGIIIVSPQGYWAWDGSTLFAAQAQAPLWLSGLTAAIVTTGNTHSNTTLDTLATTTGIEVGMGVFGSDFAAGTTVVAVNTGTSTVTLSQNATGSHNGTGVTFNWAMPSGITGSAIEIYNSTPWIIKAPRTILASAPGNGADFAVSDGAVNLTVKDNYVQNGYIGLRVIDGFLYIFGNTCVDVVSDVSTSGSPATTTFLRVPVSTVIGTPWRDTIASTPNSIVCTNATGAFEVSGGTLKKISDAMDGTFATATYPAEATDPTGFHPYGAMITLNEVICYGVTATVTDPDTATTIKSLLCWDGKRWFQATQETQPTLCASQDSDSSLVPWCSDGTTLFQGFSTPSSSLSKKAKSWFAQTESGITMRKQIQRIYAQYGSAQAQSVLSSFNIDTENGSFPFSNVGSGVGIITFINNSGGVIQFVNNSSQPIYFTGAIPLIDTVGAAVIAAIFGFTLTTVVATLDIVGFTFGYVDYGRIR